MRKKVIPFFQEIREEIIAAFEKLDTASFVRQAWNYNSGSGGGEMAVLRGSCFEKAAVNFSAVEGEVFPHADGKGPFFATGVSLITHMVNPHAPTAHMNIRYIETPDKTWFGGGYDLTPMGFPYEEDTLFFHKKAKEALTPFGETLYPQFSKAAQEYFYIPHRKKERGVGGLFFDHYKTADVEQDLKMVCAVGRSFLEAILPILEKRIHIPFSEVQKQEQHRLRAHYVEFNLLYDRGTKFGFNSGGNPEAILCSLPPVATW